jgi:hypothetical protein
MADFPQQHEVQFPGNASPAADAPLNDAPPHPQPAPSYCPLPVPGQPHGHGYAGVVPDGVVSIGVAMISHSRGAHMRCAILVPTSECRW